MRLARALLFVTLTGVLAAPAFADDTKPAEPKAEASRRKVPLRVVKMLPETHQVLLYDKSRGTHVVAEAGQDVSGYLVEDIDDDEVTLVTQNGAEVILTAPEPSWRARRAEAAREAAPASAAPAPAAPAAPAPATAGEPAPLDPYADAETATTAAPIAPGEGGVRVASATDPAQRPPPSAPAPAATAAPSAAPVPVVAAAPIAAPPPAAPAAAATPTATPPHDADTAFTAFADAVGSPAPAPAPAAAAPSVSITRHDVDAALADFGATAVTFDASFTAEGLHFDHIAKGTILARIGLQPGDTLLAVDGQPLRSLDDAATLYARAGSAKAAKLQLLRAGKPMTLAVVIR